MNSSLCYHFQHPRSVCKAQIRLFRTQGNKYQYTVSSSAGEERKEGGKKQKELSRLRSQNQNSPSTPKPVPSLHRGISWMMYRMMHRQDDVQDDVHYRMTYHAGLVSG